ncbi:hypothetical protein ACHAPK_005411 [Fusarium culmorum]
MSGSSMRKGRQYEALEGMQPASTVDSFQGQENDVAVVIMGTPYPKPGPGFTCNPKRLNVMLSRQKSALVIVGDIDVASKQARYEVIDEPTGEKHVVVAFSLAAALMKLNSFGDGNLNDNQTAVMATYDSLRAPYLSSQPDPGVPSYMLGFTFSLWLVENARPSVNAFICNITEAKALKGLSDKEMVYLYGIAKAMNEIVLLRMDYIRTLKNNSLQTYDEILKLDELKQLEDWSTYNDQTLSTNTHCTSKFPATDKAVASYGKNVDTIDQKTLIQKRAIKAEAVSVWGEIKVMIIMMHVWRQRYNVLRDELAMD